jgi:surface polysaccharide O-acyltransferase-like enzyme
MKSIQSSPEISPDISTRLTYLSFFLIIQVVFIHSYRETWGDNPYGFDRLNYFIQYLISQEICRSAVPLFFIISGYLFFIGYSANIKKWLFSKWKRRIQSLVIPYLLWSIIGIVAFYIMQSIPSAAQFFTHKLLVDYSLFDFFKTLLWHPIPYQLWFIRYLILYILITPLIFFIFQKYFGILVLSVAISLLVIFPAMVHYHLIEWFSFGAVLYYLGFYLFGIFLSINNNNKIKLDQLGSSSRTSFIFVWLILCLMETYLKVVDDVKIFGLHDLTIFMGIYCIWLVSGDIQKYFNKMSFSVLSSYTFFIFALHEPLLTILLKCGNYIVPWQSSLLLLILYFLCPIITIMVSVTVAILLSRHLPNIYKQLTGFR